MLKNRTQMSPARRRAVVSTALVIVVLAVVLVAVSTVTPVAFAALGFLPILQHRLNAVVRVPR